MSITIKHKRSAVASSKPTGAQIDNGEIAVNYSDTDPALYIKDSTGTVIRIAGNGAVGGSTSSAVAPTTPADGDTWVDISAHPPSMKVWDATTSKWGVVGVSGSGTAPTSPATGAVWVDTSTVPNVIKVWDGGNWVLQAGATITASIAPAAPATGQMWVDTSASPSPIKIWDGSSWVTTAATGAASQALANDAKYATKAEVQAEDLWDRTGTEIHPKNAGDDVFTSGDVKVGGTTSTPNTLLKADGSTVFAGKIHKFGLQANAGPQYITVTSGGTGGVAGRHGYGFRDRPFAFESTTSPAQNYLCVATGGRWTFRGNSDDWTNVGPEVAQIGGDGSAVFTGNVTATIVPPSDAKFKENITPANPQLADVVALGKQLKNFDWNDDAPLNDELRAVRQLGLIAQEAEEVSPGIVKTIKRTKQGRELTPEKVTPEGTIPATYEEVDDSFKGISHEALIMKLLGAVAELSAEVEALKAIK